MREEFLIASLALTLGLSLASCARAEENDAAFVLERTISLPDVHGRIDHIAVDPQRERLAVAELENGTVDVIDLARGRVIHRVGDMSQPQGVGFDMTGRVLAIATGGDGVLHLMDAATLHSIAAISIGEDADDVRLDPANGHVIVGYGRGALAIVDVEARAVVARIALPAHPEGFQIDPRTRRIFVNVPDRRTIAVADLDRSALVGAWRLPPFLWNYPLALEANGDRLASVFRFPSRFVLFDRTTGLAIASASVCGDADDVFLDPVRRRAYVACGAGVVDSFDVSGSSPRKLNATSTSAGARTALFDPTLDRLFVAAPARSGRQAAIVVLRPSP